MSNANIGSDLLPESSPHMIVGHFGEFLGLSPQSGYFRGIHDSEHAV